MAFGPAGFDHIWEEIHKNVKDAKAAAEKYAASMGAIPQPTKAQAMASDRSSEQKLIDITFSVAMMMHDPKFRDHFANLAREQLAEWVASQLRGCGFDTFPCGASWGVLKR